MKYSILTKCRNILAIIAIATSQVAMAQNKSIVGTLIDTETKESVTGATVTKSDNKV